MNKKKINLIMLILLLTFSATTFAQEIEVVKPFADLLKDYREKHDIISKELEQRTDITFHEKLLLYETLITKLKYDFKLNRKTEYVDKTVNRTKTYNCIGLSTRKITDCKEIKINAPNNKMYTKKEWITEEGDKGNITVDGSSVKLNMKVTGKREYTGVLSTIFKYKPQLISGIVEEETTELFTKMVD